MSGGVLSVRSWLGNAHIELDHGKVKDNVEYCKKDGKYIEYRYLQEDNVSSNKYKDAINLKERGNAFSVKQLYPALYLR